MYENKNPYGIIYCALNTNTGKFYVGQTVNTLEHRKNGHKNSKRCPLLYNSIKKHGWNAFVWRELLSIYSSQTDLDNAEKFWQHELNSIAPNGYNLIDGSLGGGGHHNEVTKRILSLKHRGSNNGMFGKTGPLNPAYGKSGPLSHRFGKKQTATTKELMSKVKSKENHPRWGKPNSPEMKLKQSKGIKAFYQNNPHPLLGIPLTKEHKEAISKGNKGRKLDLNARSNMSKAQIGNIRNGKYSWVIEGKVVGSMSKTGFYVIKVERSKLGERTRFSFAVGTKILSEANAIYEKFAQNPDKFIAEIQAKRAAKKKS